MKYLIATILLCTGVNCCADTIVNVLAKYGVDGYTSSGKSTTSSSTSNVGKNVSTQSSTNNTVSVNDKVQLVMGIGIQKVPSSDGIAVGVGYYFDNTLAASVGWKF